MGINLFSFLGYSKDFLCELNERKLFRGSSKGHLFLFKPRKYQKGNFKINYKDTTLLMWTKTNLVNILLGSKKKRVSVKTTFSIERLEFSLTLNPSVRLYCKRRKGLHLKEKESTQNEIKIPTSGKSLKINIKKPLIFKYYTADGFELTRSLIFQSGKAFNQTRAPSSIEPWCLFRIELKLNEDTLVPKGTKIPVKRAEIFKNNENFTVYSYSFVDFATGKKGMETSRFIPFSIECTIKAGKEFSKKLLEKINQGAFTIDR